MQQGIALFLLNLNRRKNEGSPADGKEKYTMLTIIVLIAIVAGISLFTWIRDRKKK